MRRGGRPRRFRSLRVWVNQLIACVPENDSSGTVLLADVADAASRFLRACAATPSAVDRVAAQALRESVAELRQLGTFRCSLAAALRFIEERAQQPTVAVDRPRPGHLHVCTLTSSGYAARPHVFVVGLEEGRVFPAAVEDPILLDTERATISPALRLSADRVDESVYTTLSRLATWSAELSNPVGSKLVSPSGTATFSYSCRDTREFRETYASWLMLQAFRVRHRDAAKGYRALHAELGTPVSCVPVSPAAAATDGGWWLSNVKVAGKHAVDPLLQQFASIAEGRKAAAARATPRFTEYDGYVPEAGEVLDPAASARAVSSTAPSKRRSAVSSTSGKRPLVSKRWTMANVTADVWLDALHARIRAARSLRGHVAPLPRGGPPGFDAKHDLEWLLDRARRSG